MTDDFLREARTTWRAEHAAIAAMQLQLRRKRWAVRRALAIELIGGGSACVVGVFFFAVALKTHHWLFILSAIALLVGMPLSMTANIQAHRAGQRWEDETPEGVVATALRRAEASMKTVLIGRWGVVTIAAFVTVLWSAQAIGLIRAASFLEFYSATAFVICVPYLLYLRVQGRRAARERAACQRLLEELDVASESPFAKGNSENDSDV